MGPPILKGKANGRIFSIGTSLTLAYVPPYANSVGAECRNIAKANLSEDPYKNKRVNKDHGRKMN